jgi:hypothetical protein
VAYQALQRGIGFAGAQPRRSGSVIKVNANDFVHRMFFADKWELLVKDYISNLECDDNTIWYKKRERNKISEELITLGYYVKYRFGQNEKISFRLNEIEGKEDGWIYENSNKLESVQIVIAYYEQEEAEEDNRTMKGEDIVPGGWVRDRIELLKQRIDQRIKKKLYKKYENIDVLLVGVKDWFVRRINDEYKDQKKRTMDSMKNCMGKSKFREIAIVDTDLVGQGALLRLPNKAN